MALVIKKKVSFDFLGEGYEGAYLVFKSISVTEHEAITKKAKEFEDKPEGSIEYMLGLLKKHFVSGKFPNDSDELTEVSSDDLDGLDAESLVRCFQIFTGQDPDPKVETPSQTT